MHNQAGIGRELVVWTLVRGADDRPVKEASKRESSTRPNPRQIYRKQEEEPSLPRARAAQQASPSDPLNSVRSIR